MQLPQHHKPSKPSAPSSCSSWIRRSPPSSPPHKKPGGGGRSRYACRLVPLLVLTVYSIFTVLRIPSSSLVVTTADSGNPRPPVLQTQILPALAAMVDCSLLHFLLFAARSNGDSVLRRARGAAGGFGGAQDPPAVQPEQPRGPRGDAVRRLSPLLRLHQR
jgi:hypothetical protein